MAAVTGISWTDSTANLWIGCSKVSPGCDRCYAEAEQDHRRHRVTWGPHGDRSYCKAGWALIRQMQRRAVANGGIDPVLGRRRRIFVNSLSDIFDNHRSIDPWRGDAFALLEESDAVDLILVTKRPQNIAKMVPAHWLKGEWPLHIWLLVSTENQDEADRRVSILLNLAWRGRIFVCGVSMEPMLGSINLHQIRGRFWIASALDNRLWNSVDGDDQADMSGGDNAEFHKLSWVIVGGESGGRMAREMPIEEARRIRDDCSAAGCAFFFKQTTNKGPIPADLMVREFPR